MFLPVERAKSESMSEELAGRRGARPPPHPDGPTERIVFFRLDI